MKDLTMIWLCAAIAVALGIALDMRRLHVNRAGLSPPGWAVVCGFTSAFAVVPYLIVRRRVLRKLFNATWTLIGDESNAPDIRRERLHALQRSGLLADAVFRACMKSLDADDRQSLS